MSGFEWNKAIQEMRKQETPKPDERDLINMAKFNALPYPVTARMLGGGEWPIESLCVQTGLMRLDVMGQIDHSEFCEVSKLIDTNGNEHDPDEFYMDFDESKK